MGKKELPKGWRWAKLGGKHGITEIINGSTPSTDEPTFWNGDILWATPTDLGKLDSIYLEDTERKITLAGLESCSTKLLPAGTVLLTSRAPVGNIAISKKPLCTNQGFKSFVPKEGIHSPYLYFAIKMIVPEIQKQSHGNTFVEITKDLIKHFDIPLPPTLDDQIAIANELERKMTEIENMRQAAMRQKEAVEAIEGATFRDIFVSHKDSKWHPTSISEISDIIMGQSPSGSTYNKERIGTPLLNGPTEFGDEHPIAIQWTTDPKKMCRIGDLIVCVRGNTTGKMNWADQEYCLGRGVAGIRGKEGRGDTNFIKYALQYKISELLSGSERSTFPNLEKDVLKSFKVFAPQDLKTQERVAFTITEKLNSIRQTSASINAQLEAIGAMPGALLREVFDFEKN